MDDRVAARAGDPAPPMILLMGPTAAGKSALALALAEALAGEIVSVDSAQVYVGMDVGTAKPDAGTRARVPHHLLDLIEPTASYSAARFRADALAAIRAIRKRGRVPIVAGGTMLYFKALTEGLSALPPADPAIRAAIDVEAVARGWPAMHAELARVDPTTAARLAPGDSQRIQRALEVHRSSGRPLADWQGRRTPADDLGRWTAIALVPTDRARLHRRIEERFDAMLAGGLVEELESLRRRFPLDESMPSMRCVGYRQAWQFLAGRVDRAGLRASGAAATRQLARRQLTWLRSLDVPALDPWAPGLVDRALVQVNEAAVR